MAHTGRRAQDQESDGSALLERSGDNALPIRGVSAAELQAFWAELTTGPRADRMTVAFADLLHRVLSPQSEMLCFGPCAHVAQGASPSQAKAFLDSLEGEAEWLSDSGGGCGGPIEPALEALERCRARFEAAARRSARPVQR